MKLFWAVLGGACCTGHILVAEPQITYNSFGMPGLIDMPSAQSAPDAELIFSVSQSGKSLRNTLTFQISPRLTGAFRYSAIGRPTDTLYDRSFDLRYRLLDETERRPSVAVGLQDFIGTGVYSGEYVAASKNLGPVVATAGIGWGRLGSHNGFDNPLGLISSRFDTRATGYTGTGGQIESARWFRGPAALFAGVAWPVNDKVTLKAEYSSDAYTQEVSHGHFAYRSPINLALDYQIKPTVQLTAYAQHGDEIGILASLTSNPKHNPNGATRDPAPMPVLPRAKAQVAPAGWSEIPSSRRTLMAALTPALRQDGIQLIGLSLTDTIAIATIENHRYQSQPQAIGHVARLLSNVLPASVDTIAVVPMVKGIAGSQVIFPRDALETHEATPTGAADMRAATVVTDAAAKDHKAASAEGIYPQFTWSFGPDASASLFDPDNPVALSLGAKLTAEWVPTRGVYITGTLRQNIVDNYTSDPRYSDSIITHVRSDSTFYDRADGPVLHDLTANYRFRPGTNLYSRFSIGYLERMYGGLSAELLWKPVDSKFGLGFEVSAVRQRSFDGLGFAPLTVTTAGLGAPRSYDTIIGHFSGYYAFENGLHAQVDLGRYLAKDWGMSLRLNREFNNGWKVGAYATLTDISFDDFGEGSFDKGIVMEIPTSWSIGRPSRVTRSVVIRPLLRDGGAKLNLSDRLYDLVRDTHVPQLEAQWGRFWR